MNRKEVMLSFFSSIRQHHKFSVVLSTFLEFSVSIPIPLALDFIISKFCAHNLFSCMIVFSGKEQALHSKKREAR